MRAIIKSSVAFFILGITTTQATTLKVVTTPVLRADGGSVARNVTLIGTNLATAASASLEDQFANDVNVSDYSEGSKDVTIKLQNILNAGAGRVVKLPAATYKTTSTLNVASNTTIIAYGAKIINNTAADTILSLEPVINF